MVMKEKTGEAGVMTETTTAPALTPRAEASPATGTTRIRGDTEEITQRLSQKEPVMMTVAGTGTNLDDRREMMTTRVGQRTTDMTRGQHLAHRIVTGSTDVPDTEAIGTRIVSGTAIVTIVRSRATDPVTTTTTTESESAIGTGLVIVIERETETEIGTGIVTEKNVAETGIATGNGTVIETTDTEAAAKARENLRWHLETSTHPLDLVAAVAASLPRAPAPWPSFPSRVLVRSRQSLRRTGATAKSRPRVVDLTLRRPPHPRGLLVTPKIPILWSARPEIARDC